MKILRASIAILFVLLVVGQSLPHLRYDYYDIDEAIIENGFDIIIGWILTVVGVLATTLSVIRNHVTALLGSLFFVINLLLASFVLYMLALERFMLYDSTVQLGPYVSFVLCLALVIISIINTVKSFQGKPKKTSADVLDELL